MEASNALFKQLRKIYAKYKEYIVPAFVLVACLLLVIFVIIPQTRNLIETKEKEEETKARIRRLKENINFISSIDEKIQDKEFQLLLRALPIEKDYVGIITAIVSASQQTGVGIGDFSFQIGSLSSDTIQEATTISFTVTLHGGIDEAKRFLRELENTLPISDSETIKFESLSTSVAVSFHYKPFIPQIIDYRTKLEPFSKQDRELISTISAW
ncbi:MAG: hypothetical protein HY429_00050 [Candidatus Levybacteria bacterium]|nr:hypothetical protein [Candidatus Levybacteria bacterium]